MAEEKEVKSTEEVKPQEPKSTEKSQEKKAPAKKKRPLNAKRKGPAAPKKPAVFSDSLEERFPALAAKLKKQIEDGIKQKIKEAQNDPKVKAASKKFADK
jgi:hypothetical protein